MTPPSQRSLLRNSAARLGSDVTVMVVGTVFATLTARWLGAAEKGVLAAISVWVAVLFQVFNLGLNEAIIVRVGQRVATIQRALTATITAAAPLAGLAGLVLVVILHVQFGDRPLGFISLVGVAIVAVSMFDSLAACVLMSDERIVTTSAINLGTQVITVAFFIAGSPLIANGLHRALTSILVGNGCSLVIGTFLVRRKGLRLSLARDTEYLRSALRYGMRAQPGIVLTSVASRLDLTLVFAVVGARAAGLYSVALSYATLVAAAPFAVAHATFPRLVKLRAEEARELTARTVRGVVLLAFTASAGMSVIAPVLVRVAFGSDFTGSVAPAIVLAFGAIPWSVQWVVSRAEGARDRPAVLLWSFVANVIVTFGTDAWLVPTHGVVGAAIGSVLGNLAGAAAALRLAGLGLADLRPGRSDVGEAVGIITSAARDALRSVRGRRKAPVEDG